MVALLGGIDGEVIAVAFLFAVLVGVLIIRPLLVSALGNAPFIGGWLSSNVDAALAGWERNMQAPAAAALGILSSTIDWLTYEWSQLLATLVGWAQVEASALTKISTVVIPAAEQAAVQYAQAATAAAEADLRSELAAVAATASAAVAGARAEELSLIAAAQAEARALSAADQALAQGLFAVAEQDAAALAQAERAFVVNDILGVQAQIQAAFMQATAVFENGEAALRGDLGTIEQQLAGTIQADVDSLLAQINADKAALTAAFTGSLAGVIADVAAIRALRCLKFCSELADVGSLLNGLDAALLIGFVAYAGQHPDEATGFLRDQVRPAVTGFASGVESLIGR
jgi:hypothetical protein